MKEVIMRIGEVCFLTNDVRRLADFYKQLLEVENNSNDETHQFILTEENRPDRLQRRNGQEQSKPEYLLGVYRGGHGKSLRKSAGFRRENH